MRFPPAVGDRNAAGKPKRKREAKGATSKPKRKRQAKHAPMTAQAWTITEWVNWALRHAIVAVGLSDLLQWLPANYADLGEPPRRRRPAQVTALLDHAATLRPT